MVGILTSGSGDCGKLVVKRESNSGIAGGCRTSVAYPKYIDLALENTYRRTDDRSLADTDIL
jgi:hypothetical protein